jgi:Ca2+-binding EF-hand superfamily protein
MITRTILIACLAALAGAGTAMAASSEPNMPTGERAFNFLDSNKDGKLTLDEIKPKAEKRVLRLDADSDGAVTAAEVDAYLAKGIERRKTRLMSRLDGDKDGKITEAEISGFIEALFNGVDSDHDGTVTLAEAREKAGKRWREIKASQGN